MMYSRFSKRRDKKRLRREKLADFTNQNEVTEEEAQKSCDEFEREHRKMCKQNMILLRKMVKDKFGTKEIIRRLGASHWSDVANTPINEICEACGVDDAKVFDEFFVHSYLAVLLYPRSDHDETSSLVWSDYSNYYQYPRKIKTRSKNWF